NKRKSIHKVENSKMEEKKKKEGSQSIAEITKSIDRTISEIEGLPGFQSIIEDLKLKKHHLNNRSLTIALFGAFSAGKSSFSNALIGEDRKSTRLNSSHVSISYAVFCLKKKNIFIYV